jgi:hypothetical protein
MSNIHQQGAGMWIHTVKFAITLTAFSLILLTANVIHSLTYTLTVNQNGQSFVLKDSSGNTLYDHGSGGTTITVTNLEQITVKDPGGNILFTWSAP